MEKLTWTVEFSVDPSWIADGFDLTEDKAHEMIAAALPHAFNHEIESKVIKTPDKKTIDGLQDGTLEA
jgi:hypothetical protein